MLSDWKGNYCPTQRCCAGPLGQPGLGPFCRCLSSELAVKTQCSDPSTLAWN